MLPTRKKADHAELSVAYTVALGLSAARSGLADFDIQHTIAVGSGVGAVVGTERLAV